MPDANAEVLVVTLIVSQQEGAKGETLGSQENIFKRSGLTIPAINEHKQNVIRQWLSRGIHVVPVIHAVVALD